MFLKRHDNPKGASITRLERPVNAWGIEGELRSDEKRNLAKLPLPRSWAQSGPPKDRRTFWLYLEHGCLTQPATNFAPPHEGMSDRPIPA